MCDLVAPIVISVQRLVCSVQKGCATLVVHNNMLLAYCGFIAFLCYNTTKKGKNLC